MSSTADRRSQWDFVAAENVPDRRSLPLMRWQWLLYICSLLLSDVMMTSAAFRLAYWIRFETSLPIFRLEVEPSFEYYTRLVFLAIPGWILVFGASGLYQRSNLLGGTKEYDLFFQATTLGLLLVIVAGFLGPNILFARGWLLLAWFLTFILGVLGRFSLRRVVYRLRQYGYFLAPALIIGANEEARLLASQLTSWTKSGLQLKGVLQVSGRGIENGFPEGIVLGDLSRLDEFVAVHDIREIIVATSALTREEMISIFRRYGVSSSINVRLSSGLFEIITTGLRVKELAYVPLVSVDKVRLTGKELIVKLAMDYFLAGMAVALLAPVYLMIAAAIKLDSPGPIIHRRRVMGLNGVQFDAFKFRTMHVDGDAILDRYPELQKQLSESHKLREDPRITRTGKLLRKYSLDEIPQFINVLRGEMSLVGPRMITADEVQKYDQWGLNLLTIKPGITGLWQVSGRADISYQERVKMDMYYIRNWNIWFDIYLLLQTLPAVLKGKGAY